MKLFEEFQPISIQQWEEKILIDLKINSIDELIWHTKEGIDFRPFYHPEHLKNLSVQPRFLNTDFDIVQYVPAFQHTAEEINENLIKSLNGGATGIQIEFYQKYNFTECFNNISLLHIYSDINLSFDAIDLFYQLKDIYNAENEYTKQKNCFINIDPVFLLEKFGNWHINKEKDFEILSELNHIPVNAVLYKESGANIIQELAYTLAHLNEYLYYLDKKNYLNKYKTIHINISIGHSFFAEIAKLRALRKLTQHLLNEYQHSANIYIHAQTTLINKSFLDIYNNTIRTTTEAMSAIFGCANSISVLPFDFPFKKISDFSLRLARNQLILMKEESYLNKTADPAFGNYYIETLTHQLIEKAYQKFLDIEKQDGIITLLKKNSIQSEIQQSYENQFHQYLRAQNTIIGVTKYPNPDNEIINNNFYSMNLQDDFSKSRILPLKYRRWAEQFEQKKQTV